MAMVLVVILNNKNGNFAKCIEFSIGTFHVYGKHS